MCGRTPWLPRTSWLWYSRLVLPTSTAGGARDPETPKAPHPQGFRPMGLLGTLSNLESQERLGRLAAKLDRLAGSDAVPRATSPAPQRRCGDVSKAVAEVLRDFGEPLRMIEIHAAVEALLGEAVPRSTIKNCLANNSRGDGAWLVRLARGRYGLTVAQATS